MRISDWSSDVCSSDLSRISRQEKGPRPRGRSPCFPAWPKPYRYALAYADRPSVVPPSTTRCCASATPVSSTMLANVAGPVPPGSVTSPMYVLPLYSKASTPLLAVGSVLSRSEEHTSELQSLMRNAYDGCCL